VLEKKEKGGLKAALKERKFRAPFFRDISTGLKPLLLLFSLNASQHVLRSG
jgi:hypothetical protein